VNRTAAKLAFVALLVAAVSTAARAASDPWLDRVRAFEPGSSAGFGAESLPKIVLGPPLGLGQTQGSLDVVSLGGAGQIVVSFDDNAVVDGEGDDLVIFENAFYGGSLLFEELAYVEVSADGRVWTMFPFDAVTHEGLAGRTPVDAGPSTGIDPLSDEAGGDRFDLADLGLDFVRFLRITDAGDEIDDPGNHSFAGTKGGFDLDAAAALHSIPLGCIAGTVTSSAGPVGGARVKLDAEGERRRRRRSGEDGRFRFCRLRPGLDYDLRTSVDGVGAATGRVYIGGEQLRAAVDLVLE
jgi:hypothetical protein